MRFLHDLVAALAAGSALAQQPVQPLPKVGGCPLGYYSSGGYCVPSSGGNTRGAIEKSGAGCPLGFYSSGNYCLSSPSNEREAIQKSGKGCPLAWFPLCQLGFCLADGRVMGKGFTGAEHRLQQRPHRWPVGRLVGADLQGGCHLGPAGRRFRPILASAVKPPS